jgi:hypothetical protein
MTFATQIARQGSERTFLARLTAKRNVTSTLVLSAGTTYTVSVPYNVSSVTRNGVAMTQITSGSPTNGQFIYDQATQVLTLNSTTAPNVSTGVFIVFYRIYLCTGAGTVACDDPSGSVGLVQQWEPRITESPSFGSYYDDALAGVFSYGDVSLSISNGDAWFQQFLTANDSFKSSAAEIWYFIDDIANIQRFYTGSLTKISGREGEFTLTLSDAFNRLRIPAFMGDTKDESYFEFSGFPNVDPNKNGQPCRFVTGSSSPWRQRIIGIDNNSISVREIDQERTQEAVCTSFAVPSTTTNRQWGLCRLSGDIPSNSFTSITRVLYGGEKDFAVFINGSSANYQIGDTFRWIEGGVTYCGVVGINTAFVLGGLNYNLYIINCCRQSNGLSATVGAGTLTTGSTNVATPSLGILIQYGPRAYYNNWYARYGADYTRAVVATSGGNGYARITFVNNFEAHDFEDAVDNPTLLTPQQHKIFFRLSNNAPLSHGDLLKKMVEASGLVADAASFTQADTDLAADTYMQIPTTAESDYQSYIKYAQQVLKSTLGFLTVNEMGEVIYRLIAAPSGTSDLDENNAAIQSIDIDYNDIVKTIIFYNEDLSDNPDVTQTSNVARYLHQTENVERFVHVLTDISARAATIFNIRKNRYAVYKHLVAHTESLLALGDDVTLSNVNVLGGSGTVSAKIVGLTKGADSLEVESTDLLSS